MAQTLQSLSPSDATPFSIYLPIVAFKQGVTAWEPWAFQDQTVTKLLAGVQPGELWSLTPEGLYRSFDYGDSWVRTDETLPWVPSLLTVEDNLLPDAGVYAAHWTGKIYVTYDSGNNWELDFDYGSAYLDFIDFVGGTLFAQTYSPYQLWQRLVSGEWQQVGNSLQARVNDVEIFQSTLYVGTETGLFRLDGDVWKPVTVDIYAELNQDQTEWISLNLQLDWQRDAAVRLSSTIVHSLFVHDGIMFVSISPRGLYKSTDGVTWTACDVGLTNAYSVAVWKIAAAANGRLFAAAASDGVFVSDNLGDRWQALDGGLPHTFTAYGVLLDDINATSLTLVRDEGDEQTLAAVFNNKGVWFLPIIGETLLEDLSPQTPPKAVLVVGPIDPPDHTNTKYYIEWADRLAAIMENNGMHVIRIYWPDSNWTNVRQAISGASIIVYKGHGFGLGELPTDPTEMYGGLNGFCLVHPEEPAGAILGTQDMLVTTNRLAENAIGFFFCCSCAGTSSADASPVSEGLARRRIEAYSSTIIRMGGGGYFSGINEEGLLEDMFAHPDKTLGELYRDAAGSPDHMYPHILWPNMSVWFDGNTTIGWNQAFVGNSNLTGRDILGW